MTMNREQKRLMQRQGQVGADGAPTRAASTPGTRKPAKDRVSIGQFFREVREEMRQVTWPTRPELWNYVGIVSTVLVLMTALIYAMNWVFSHFVIYLFQT
jgi:preprotein translocase subunit SecE